MKGEIRILIEGLRLEKLLRRALADGVSFKKIGRIDKRTITVDVMCGDAETLLALCKRYSVAARIQEMRGRPMRRRLLHRRVTLPVGIAVFFILCWLVLGRIWLIDVSFTGPQAQLGRADVIKAVLSNTGIRPGVSAGTDAKMLSGMLEAELEGFSYISAKIQGVLLVVEAAPETPEPGIYDIGYARDLYSRLDGIVESVEVHSGIACVQPGDVVKRGQLLIRGEERISAEETRSIGAKGEVIVRTWFEGAAALNTREYRSEPTGRTSTSTWLQLLNHSFPIVKGETFDQASHTIHYLPIGGMFIPLEIVRDDASELHTILSEMSLETLSDRLHVLSMADAAIKLTLSGPNAFDISRSWIRFEDPDEGMLKAYAVYEIYTDAAATQGALLQGG